MSKFHLAAASCSLALACTTVASAQSPRWCNEYANQAVISATQNKTMGCGFWGGRWGFNYRVHYNWCMSVPQDVALQERLLRQRAIQSCNGGPTR